MNELNKAVSLFNDSSKIKTHISRYKEATKPHDVDKHGNKFCKGRSDRFVAQPLPMYLECYKGYYGNSSCSTISLGSNSDEIQDAYVSWANKNMQLILDGIAQELEIAAQQLKDKCKQEIDQATALYQQAFEEK